MFTVTGDLMTRLVYLPHITAGHEKLSACRNVVIKSCTSNHHLQDVHLGICISMNKVRQILWPHYYNTIGKHSNVFHSESTCRSMPIISKFLCAVLTQRSICSFDPMTSPSGHSRPWSQMHFSGYSFWYKRDTSRTAGMVTKCFSRRGASNDMQHDLLNSTRTGARSCYGTH